MLKHNVISWTGMMVGYAQKGHGHKALSKFSQMHFFGMKPNKHTFSSVLSACARLTALKRGQRAHVHIVITGYAAYAEVSNSLVTMYVKSGSIDNAEKVYKKMLV